MAYRGRLLHKLQVEIYQLDGPATADVVGGGYDDVFREPLNVTNPNGSAVGLTSRREKAPILLPCQVEPVEFKGTQMTPAGDNPRTQYQIILRYKDLERLGMVDEHGMPKLRKRDRVSRVLTMRGVEQVNFGPEVYIDKMEPDGIGLGMVGTKRNLLVLTLVSQDKGFAPA